MSNSRSEFPEEYNNESQYEDGFEGPEKNLQIIFTKSTQSQLNTKSNKTLLNIQQEEWEKMLDKAKCKILSSISNSKCTSYILSESSLFVFEDKIILKTCGTTPLLLAIDDALSIGKSIGFIPAVVLYWRKNFCHPENQHFPHKSFSTEVEFLDAHFGSENSSTVRCGPIDHDHWFFYYADMIKDKSNFKGIDTTFELKMHEIHPESSQYFYNNFNNNNNELVDIVRSMIPDSKIDDFFFDPCGYSMNGLIGETDQYETLHITPENKCSYVSFESTEETFVSGREWAYRILELFRPASFTAVEISSSPRMLSALKIDGYVLTCPCSMHLLDGLYITFWSYTLAECDNHPLAKVSEIRIRALIRNYFVEELQHKFLRSSENENNNFFLVNVHNKIQEILA
ncbi:S-adenosylmethionine decarboxylase proenzyme [Tritrichomonas foetus]|uniref:adenosylmethionine decarboxylase n=1 Tax=Tritrichomonas foetus TaxID=1144522 RepID=A0A1J4JSX7_9EUKA|nr:S-adenosylmethionine decarboxylase proenzyme [Tritrichomonas foetus]|eukprot:OHT02217.1 S-adenosylmethionine decarboxylase proenzyme [Tritrichomonas foetus]